MQAIRDKLLGALASPLALYVDRDGATLSAATPAPLTCLCACPSPAGFRVPTRARNDQRPARKRRGTTLSILSIFSPLHGQSNPATFLVLNPTVIQLYHPSHCNRIFPSSTTYVRHGLAAIRNSCRRICTDNLVPDDESVFRIVASVIIFCGSSLGVIFSTKRA